MLYHLYSCSNSFITEEFKVENTQIQDVMGEFFDEKQGIIVVSNL